MVFKNIGHSFISILASICYILCGEKICKSASGWITTHIFFVITLLNKAYLTALRLFSTCLRCCYYWDFLYIFAIVLHDLSSLKYLLLFQTEQKQTLTIY